MTDTKTVNAKEFLAKVEQRVTKLGALGVSIIGAIKCLLEIAPDASAPVWTACSDGLPMKSGMYMATVQIDNVFQHGVYEKRTDYDADYKSWPGMSSDMKVIAWREESPYDPNRAQEA